MSLRDNIGRLFRAIRGQIGQWYSPQEQRALFLFLIVGVGVLLYRSGATLYRVYFPGQVTKAEAANNRVADSLFAALSAKARKEDSLIFALPEDSIAPKQMRRGLPKGSLLAPNSIALNGATRDQLMQLPGVGPSTADKILAYRAERHRFRSVDELGHVKTIGKKRLARMKPYLRLD